METLDRRTRNTVRVDGDRLRAERDARRDEEGAKFTQKAMARHIGIGLATYQRAEAGQDIDRVTAGRIADALELDDTDLGLQRSTAPAPPDTGTYLNLLHNECSFIDVRGLIVGSGKAPRLPIAEVYIPLRIAGGAEHGKAKAEHGGGPAEPQSTSLDKALEHRKLVIVGDPGSGKSTYLKRLACEQSGPGATQFPVFIRIFALEEFIHKRVRGGAPDTPDSDSADWIPRYLADRAAEFQWGLDADFFRRKLRERSTLILLDGLDEVPNAARRESIARLFERATRAYRDARFVVTTRPAAYKEKATLEEFREVKIGDLDDEARDGFLEHWSGFLFNPDKEGARRHTDELRNALRARPEIRIMARNPLMLTALAVIQWNDRKLPEQRADLYESILKWLSEAHDYKDRPQGQRCLAIFSALALGMQTYPAGRVKQIEKAEAAKILAPEFREAPAEHRESAALEFLESELVDSGIVVSRGDSLEFWHLTFQEYLAARACADFDAPANELLFADRWSLQEWREVMLLVPGVLIRTGQKRVDAIFRALLDRTEGGSSTLANKARAAGLLGAALFDLRPSKYRPPDETRYDALLSEIRGIFDAKRSAGIDLSVRVEAAEALGQAGDPRLTEDNWVTIPAGTFLLGAQKARKNKPGYDPEAEHDEGPVREVSFEKPFQIGRYPVTVEEYKRFVEDEIDGPASAPSDWDEQLLHPNRPAVSLTWFDAAAYCKWAGLRLPTEEEWEFAARGTEARKYPWGKEQPDARRANYYEVQIGKPTPVGLFPAGNTPEGVADMAGNVWEWTDSEYDKDSKAVRGASFVVRAGGLRAARRFRSHPVGWFGGIGFRCVRE